MNRIFRRLSSTSSSASFEVGINALPSVGDLVEIRRFKRVSCGILLSQDDSLLDSSNSRNGAQNVKSGGEALRVLFPNGFVSLHYVNEVTFRLPRWLHSPFIRDSSGACPESTALVEKSSLYISSDAVRMLESMSVNPKAAIYHLLEFLKSTEQYEIEFKRNFMGLHSTILSLEGKEHRLLANRLAGPQDDYNFSVIEAARLVFYNDTSMKDLSIIPTGGELLSTFKYLMKNSLLFTPRALDNTQLRQDLVFRARSPPEIGSMFWLENEILGERAAGKPGFQDYVEVMQSDLYTKFARHTPWYRNSSRSATLDSFLSKVKQRLLDPSYKISSLEQTDLFICQQIKEAIVSPAHFASESARLIEAAVLKPLAPLLVKGPRPRNSHDVFVEAGARVLVAVGVWPVWMTFQFVKSLMKYSGKATMFDGASQGADWIDQAFQASEKWASHILKSSSETLKCISTTPATASSTSPPLSPPSLPPPSSTPGGSMDSKFLQSLEPLLVLPSNNCRPGSSILNGLDTLSTDSVATSRVDCHSTVFVIDDPTAHELDDGISIEPLDPSKANSPDLSDYWVKIHIADPTALVMADSPVALVAQIRATTAYFPEKHHPMMPDQLSDERFNLSIRGAYALTFSARVSGIGEIIDYKVEPSVLRSVEKCHYNDVDKILDWSGIEGIDINGQGSSSSIGGDFAPWVTQTLLAKAPMFTHTSTNITPALVLEKDKSSTLTAFPRGWVERNRAKLLMLQRIAKAHTSHRVANGAMGRSSPSYHLSVTPYNPKYDGDTTIHLDPYRDSTLSPSHNMVSEFMVIAGRVAAKFCTEHKLSVPFRGQVSMYDVPLEAATRVVGDSHGFSLTPTVGSFLRQLPPNNSFKELAEFVAAARCSVSGNMSYFEYNKILRYMPPATIDLRPIQHFSMGIPGVNPLSTSSSSSTSPFMHSSMNGYLKATSPLRRYSDMIVHWQIKSKLAQLSSGATLPSFNEADLKRLIPRLHAKEKISKISSMQDRSWLLEWCRRREEMAQTLSRDCVSDGSFESGLVSRDRHRGIGLKNTNMTIKRGGLLETAWSIANVADPVQSARPVYTGVVCNVPDPGSTGRSDYHVMLTELGGFVAKLHSTDIVRYNIGDIVSCRVENINSFRGQLDRIPSEHSSTDATGLVNTVLCSPIANLGLADLQIYDIEGYFDIKSNEKVPAYKFYLKEADHIATLIDLLKMGKSMVAKLYSYRSCVRGLPQIQSGQANKNEINMKIFEVLKPEISKMRDFMKFRDDAVHTVTDVFSSMTIDIREKDLYASSEFLSVSAEILDLFVVMDAMKNIKGSMNNDLSMYKRAMTNLPREIAEQEAIINQKLYMFLGQHDQFAFELKKSLSSVNGSDDLVQDIITHCADCVDGKRYLLPETKHSFLKAIAFGLFILDGDGDEKDITKRKKLKIDRFGKLFKTMPIVPLFGDSPIHLSQIYIKAPHIGHGKWDLSEPDEKITQQKYYHILSYLEATKSEYIDFCALFGRTINTLKMSVSKNGKLDSSESFLIYSVVSQGLKILSTCATRVQEQTAFKFAYPANPATLSGVPEDALAYELAVKYNYTKDEKQALVEFLCMIKNISGLLYGLDRQFIDGIRSFIYSEIQTFVQGNLLEYISHTSKKKKPIASVLKVLQDLASDGYIEERDVSPSKSKPSLTLELKQSRTDPFSLTQLYFMRAYVDFGFNEKSKGMKGGLMKEKDFKENHVAEVDRFFESSILYPYMIDLRGTVLKCSDLSDLWYKEFYLELSKQIQFPISMSLPWILSEFIMESNDVEMTGNMFIPFEIYNDAAKRTLYDLESRYIYDEIAAEVNLCFSKLINKISQKIFTHFKKAAASSMLASDFKSDMDPTATRGSLLDVFDSIINQNQLQLLGRSINIADMIRQMLNDYLRKSIDTAISRYESSDLTAIKDLDMLLNCTKLTHELLIQYLQLDSFEEMLTEVDESVQIQSVGGRILSHTIQEFIDDFIPNFAYNSVTGRFVRSPCKFVEPIVRANHNKASPIYLYGSKALGFAFHTQNSLYSGFIGEPHFTLIVKIIGRKAIPFIIGEVKRHVDTLLHNTMTAYITVIQNGLPTSLKLPLLEYGTAGAFEYFAAHFKPLLQYADLKSQVLQTFREVGNSILLTRSLQDAIELGTSWDKVQTDLIFKTHELQSSIADPLFEDSTGQSPLHWMVNIETMFQSASRGVIFKNFLQQLRVTLKQLNDEWNGIELGIIDNPRAFFKVWSAVLFAFCIPPSAEDSANRELFGDGVVWAGSTFIYCLDQLDLFNALDFNNHILYVHKSSQNQSRSTSAVNPNTGVVSIGYNGMGDLSSFSFKPELVQFLENASFFQNVVEEINDTLSLIL